jgi:copper transport protein
MAGVVAIAALLAHTDLHAGHEHHQPDATTPAGGITLRLEAGERVAAVEIYPGKPGRNTLTVTFTSKAGRPLAPLEASLELALPGARIEAFAVKLSPLVPGKFAAEIAELAVPGRWQLRIDALITDFEKAIFRGEAEIK